MLFHLILSQPYPRRAALNKLLRRIVSSNTASTTADSPVRFGPRIVAHRTECSEETVAELYDTLGLTAAASAAEIREAITQQRRTWRRRATSPDIAARQEAERRMHLLDEAERTLLDPELRASYDDEDTAIDPGPEGRWIVKALEQIDRGQHGAAVFSAKRAVGEDPENPYAYSVLAEAALSAGDEWAAAEAVENALRLEPEDARLHAQRAGILAAADDGHRAVSALRAAISLAPDEPDYHARLVQLLTEQGEVDAAMEEGEIAYRAHPDEGAIRNALAAAIAERAVLAHHELPDGRLIVTTPEQASYVESLCERGLSVQPTDEELAADLNRQLSYARRAQRKRISAAQFRKKWKWPVGMGMFALAGLCYLPGAMKAESGAKGGALILVVGLIAVFALSVRLSCYEWQYARNAKLIERNVPRRMGQPQEDTSHTPKSFAAVRPRAPKSSRADRARRP